MKMTNPTITPKKAKTAKTRATTTTASKQKAGCLFKWHQTPDAKEVLLAGDFTNWNPLPMTKNNGMFHTSVKLPPGEYRYKFVVDGIWHSDPAAEESMINEYGTRDSLMRVE